MPFKGVVDPQQLAILVDILNRHCARQGIAPESPDRLDIAEVLVTLHSGGLDSEADLLSSLDAALARRNRLGL